MSMKQNTEPKRVFWMLWVWIAVCCLCISCSTGASDSGKHCVLVFRRSPVEDLADVQFDNGDPIDDPLALLNVEDGTLWELPNFPVFALETRVINEQPTLAWSPDGQYVLYVGSVDNRNREVYRASADGSEVVNLTNHPAADEMPIWSPDGRYIAFTSGRDICGPDRDFVGEKVDDPMIGCARLYVMRPDGSGVRRLRIADEGIASVSWSPDSQHLVIQVGTSLSAPDSSPQVYVVSLEGSELRELIELDSMPDPMDMFSDPRPYWLPDGEYIHLAMSTDYLIYPDGSGLRRLVSPSEIVGWSVNHQSDPAWSPDGKPAALYFLGDAGLVLLDIERGTITELGYTELFKGVKQSLTWTPDGKRIIFKGYSGEGKYDIYSLDIESRELVNLTAAYPESFTLIPEWVAVTP